jgi:large subunit ribosomal protein L43
LRSLRYDAILTSLRDTADWSQNGVGAFILQCKKLEFHYCDWAGSSRGMNSFIKTFLPAFAKRNPQIEMFISPRPRKHPVIRAHYINGAQRSICVRNMEAQTVRDKAELLRDASGEKNRKLNKPVTSLNESVRGIWSPFHGDKIKI